MLKVINNGKMGTRATKYSTALDLYANEDVVIGAGGTAIVGLGVCIDLEAIELELIMRNINPTDFSYFLNSHYLQLNPRSSLRARGLISNTGIIDLDYKDEIKIIIHNPHEIKYEQSFDTGIIVECENQYVINKGDKIAQITLLEHESYLFNINTDTERDGGFGSTN